MPKAKYKTRLSDAEMMDAVNARLKHGSVKAGAAALGIGRSAMQQRLHNAALTGLTEPRRTQANPSRWRPGAEIVAARKAEFERYKASVAKNGNVIHLPDNSPFMVVVLGDPHLDNPGTDLELWERWIGVLDRGKRRTAILMGDNLDNWPRVLGHLFAEAETAAPEGWILFEHYLEQIADNLDASISGNHDDWSGTSDVLGMMMRQTGALHEHMELRFAYRTPEGREITVKGRHKWAGNSMWNPVHAISRAAQMGDRETILLGGHWHTSGDARVVCPKTGFVTHCHQVGAFKRIDAYVKKLGLRDQNMAPGVALVIDPRRADTDPELVKSFHDPVAGSDFLAFLRRRK
jgi:hypothetical protein